MAPTRMTGAKWMAIADASSGGISVGRASLPSLGGRAMGVNNRQRRTAKRRKRGTGRSITNGYGWAAGRAAADLARFDANQALVDQVR
jgi:hypothetical protein